MLLTVASCPNEKCKNHEKRFGISVERWYKYLSKIYTKNGSKTRYICLECGKTFYLTYYDSISCEYKDFNLKDVVSEYKNGVTLKEISETLGISEKRVFSDIEWYL